MKKRYNHLTCGERHSIEMFLREGYTQSEIAEMTGRSGSTISRELRRNSGLRGYRHKQAQEKARERRSYVKRARIWTEELAEEVRECLEEDWSPEQISGWGRSNGIWEVSHERIYQYIREDRKQGGELYRHLRQGRKKRRRRCHGDSRGRIPGRVSIEKRPKAVERRRQLGHWEADLVSGANHRGFLVVAVERVSLYTRMVWVADKRASTVSAALIQMLRGHTVRSLTVDNGKEFAEHARISRALKGQVYFANPYRSWERGTNENLNGLIRQYYPKKTDMSHLDADELKQVEERLNTRPRKKLDWTCPNDHAPFLRT